MKLSTWYVLVVGTLAGALTGTAEAQKLGNSFSASVGYWKPSLEEVNDALQLWANILEDEGINPRGDDKFSWCPGQPGHNSGGAALGQRILEEVGR